MNTHEIEVKKFEEFFNRYYPNEKDGHFHANVKRVWMTLAEKRKKNEVLSKVQRHQIGPERL